jgi:putative DNA modification/repair radical SAM protein
MEVRSKLAILADAAKYDASCSSSGGKRKSAPGGIGNVEGTGICHSYTPDGRCISLLKILLTNFCIYDCRYCINRISSDVERARFSVAEVVQLTLDFYKRNYIEGLFLSSGVMKSSDETMEEMVEVARQLREVHRFGGYIHLKAVAGCSAALLEKAGLYADRLSANIELPVQKDLDSLAPAKKHLEIESSMNTIRDKISESVEERKKSRKAPIFASAGQSTQMIVGATPSSDRDIMIKASSLYKLHGLKRVYYSAFSPIQNSHPSLPLKSPPLIREHRLYQTDWLLRFYGFKAEEILPEANANLDLNMDPKLAWGLRNRNFFPVDVNKATKETLLRVPGLGVKNVLKIIEMRRFRKLRLEDLGKMHIAINRVKYFITALDFSPALKQLDSSRLFDYVKKETWEQLELFSAASSALTGQV